MYVFVWLVFLKRVFCLAMLIALLSRRLRKDRESGVWHFILFFKNTILQAPITLAKIKTHTFPFKHIDTHTNQSQTYTIPSNINTQICKQHNNNKKKHAHTNTNIHPPHTRTNTHIFMPVYIKLTESPDAPHPSCLALFSPATGKRQLARGFWASCLP